MYPAVCLVQEYQLDGQVAGQVQGGVGCYPAVCLVQEYQLDGQGDGYLGRHSDFSLHYSTSKLYGLNK